MQYLKQKGDVGVRVGVTVELYELSHIFSKYS